MNEIKTILVVGYGSMGRRRIRLAGELLPNAKFVCVDSNEQRQIQARDDGHISVSSIEKGLEFSPEVAFVCTSPGHHADIILKLLDAGIHVFTELNLTSDRYELIAEMAKKNNVTVFVSSTLIYKKQMEIFKSVVNEQNKPLTYIYHVGQYLPDWHPWESYKNFFIGKKETNGIREILAIQLPWIIDTFGNVKDVKVVSQRCTTLDIDFPDSVILNLVHENGCIGSFVVDVTSRKPVTRLEIIGEDLHLFWDGHNDDLRRLNLGTNELEKVPVYETEQHIEGYSDNIAEEPYRDEIKEFIGAINDRKVRYGLEQDAYILSLIDKIESEYGNLIIYKEVEQCLV